MLHLTPSWTLWYVQSAFVRPFRAIRLTFSQVFILPIPVISGIAAARKIRVGLMSTFALGAFVIAASIARMVHLRGSAASTKDPTWGSMPALIWTEVEANTAVIVCCCPALPALVKKLWKKMRRVVGQSVSLDSGSPKLPLNQGSTPRPPSPPAKPTSQTSRRRASILDCLASLWRIITRKPNDPNSNTLASPYTQGYLTYAQAGKVEPSRWNCFGSRKRHSNNPPTTGDEELAVMQPVSYLSPKIISGKIFTTKKAVEGPIMRTQDVTVSSHRRSILEQMDGRFERAEFTRQNTEREKHQERRFDRRAAGIS